MNKLPKTVLKKMDTEQLKQLIASIPDTNLERDLKRAYHLANLASEATKHVVCQVDVITDVQDLLHKLSTCLNKPGWSPTSTGTNLISNIRFWTMKDPNGFWLNVYETARRNPNNDQDEPTLVLQSLVIPETQRRRGWANQVLQHLETLYVARNLKQMMVEPIVSPEMSALCQKRQYTLKLLAAFYHPRATLGRVILLDLQKAFPQELRNKPVDVSSLAPLLKHLKYISTSQFSKLDLNEQKVWLKYGKMLRVSIGPEDQPLLNSPDLLPCLQNLLVQVRQLHVSNCTFKLVENLPKLEILDVSWMGISTPNVEELIKLARLTTKTLRQLTVRVGKVETPEKFIQALTTETKWAGPTQVSIQIGQQLFFYRPTQTNLKWPTVQQIEDMFEYFELFPSSQTIEAGYRIKSDLKQHERTLFVEAVMKQEGVGDFETGQVVILKATINSPKEVYVDMLGSRIALFPDLLDTISLDEHDFLHGRAKIVLEKLLKRFQHSTIRLVVGIQLDAHLDPRRLVQFYASLGFQVTHPETFDKDISIPKVAMHLGSGLAATPQTPGAGAPVPSSKRAESKVS